MKDIHILQFLCKYLPGGRVTLGERAFGQILTLSDHPSSAVFCLNTIIYKDILT